MEYKGKIDLREPVFEIVPTFSRVPGQFPPVTEPVRIMDDLFFIGRVDTGCLAVRTSEGIVMIDAINPETAAADYILPGLEKLGLGGEKVLACFISHGHGDHFGGAQQLRELTGCKLYMNRIDVPLMKTPDSRGNYHPYPDPIDVFVEDGDEYTFGDKTFYIVHTPGHTEGCISIIFPVTDRGEKHVAAIWGGTGMPLPNVPDRTLCVCDYIKSAARFAQKCDEKNVDVEVSAHPFIDSVVEKGQKLRERKEGEPNVFVIGKRGVAEFMYQRMITGLTEAARLANEML